MSNLELKDLIILIRVIENFGINFEFQRSVKLISKFVWELNDKYYFIVDFLFEVWNDKKDIKFLNIIILLFDLMSLNFF